jgi:protoporphyrinogen oxidase
VRPVVIIGGGLGGLSAAYALEARGIPYTIIELKPRLGGSLGSSRPAGFLYDSSRMLTLDRPDHPVFARLGRVDALAVVRTDEDGDWMAFRDGHQALIDALAKPLTGTVLYRMAVTSAGEFDARDRARGAPRFCVCLENGTVIDASGLIIAAPARYAERILRSLNAGAASLLDDYRYDSIARVNLGYRLEDVRGRLPETPPDEYPLTYIHTITLPSRVPDGGVLVQAGIRFDPAKGLSPETGGDAAGAFAALFGLPETPLFEHVSIWPEDEPLMWLDDDFGARMERLTYALPEGAAVAGSDYVATGDHRPTLAERVQSGFDAAARVIEAL